FYGLWVQDGFRTASDDAERIAGTALKLQVDLLDARRLGEHGLLRRARAREKAFLLRQELDDVTRHAEVSRNIESSLSSLRESAQVLAQSELAKQVASITNVFGGYKKHFDAIGIV